MHKSHIKLLKELEDAAKLVKVGSLYYHYKKPQLNYKVIKLAITESDDSVCVIYESQYEDNLVFVRPLGSWLEKVSWKGKIIDRFTLLK